jgi:hypothetical protein
MNPSFRFGAGGDRSLRVSWGNSERVFRRGRRQGGNGNRSAVLAVRPAAEHPRPHSLNRLRYATRKRRLQLPQEHDPMRSIVPLRQD